MVNLTKEEVIGWFSSLNGAKRIELMCGLLNRCIPLECRFFASILEDLCRQNYSSLLEADIKANSTQEFELLASGNLLASDVTMGMKSVINPPAVAVVEPQPTSNYTKYGNGKSVTGQSVGDHDDVAGGNAKSGSKVYQAGYDGSKKLVNGVTSNWTHSSSSSSTSSTSPASSPSGGNKGTKGQPPPAFQVTAPDTVASGAQTPGSSMDDFLYSVRSRIVVCLSLLSSTNRLCANFAFKALSDQLSVENLDSHLPGGGVYDTVDSNGVHSSKRKSPMHDTATDRHSSQMSMSSLVMDDRFYDEILLLFTLAINHPAFTLEQKTVLTHRMESFHRWITAVRFAMAAVITNNSAAGHAMHSPQINHPSGPPTGVQPPSLSGSTSTLSSGCKVAGSHINSAMSTPSTSPSPPTTPAPVAQLPPVGPPPPVTIPPPMWLFQPQVMPSMNGYSSMSTPQIDLFNWYYSMVMATMATTQSFHPPGAYYVPRYPGQHMPMNMMSGYHQHPSLAAAAINMHPTKQPSAANTCFNCGQYGHRGDGCTQQTIDEYIRPTTFNMSYQQRQQNQPRPQQSQARQLNQVHHHQQSQPSHQHPQGPQQRQQGQPR